ncbi:hypothetical protein JWG39_10225, partial [Desulforhopalus vacuolatus]|nr:hypothetical protein [Desulforhopalus vacuolatus]
MLAISLMAATVETRHALSTEQHRGKPPPCRFSINGDESIQNGNGIIQAVDEGTPQGGPLSPLLSNIVLDELDKELEKRNLCFVRYADDCVPRRRTQVCDV